MTRCKFDSVWRIGNTKAGHSGTPTRSNDGNSLRLKPHWPRFRQCAVAVCATPPLDGFPMRRRSGNNITALAASHTAAVVLGVKATIGQLDEGATDVIDSHNFQNFFDQRPSGW